MIDENKKIDDLTQKNYTVASLFAGIGGFCLAFKNVGFNILWANEKDSFAIQTYKHNFPAVSLYEQSITDLSVLRDQLEMVDVLTAGFPCQPFSVAGYQNGFNDPRGKLFFDIIRILREFGKNRPKILLLENVKNLLTHDSGKTFSRVMAEIQSVGYWFKRKNVAVLNTFTHTKIPQNRERLYMAALSSEYFAYNDFLFPEKTEDKIFYRDLLDLNSQADPEYYFEPGTQYWNLFNEEVNKNDPNSVYQLRRFYVRELKNYLVPTLTANMGEGGHNKPVIKDAWGIRNLTPRECLRLQGFDENKFSFPESMSKTQQYRQIGNTVTVVLVESLAKECLAKLNSLGWRQ